MKIKIAAVVMFSIIMIGASAGTMFAFGPSDRSGPSQKRVERITKQLGLNAEQKAALMKDVQAFQAEAPAIKEKNKALFDKIREEMLKDEPDRTVIHGYMKQINENNLSLQLKRMDQMISLKKSLDSGQKKKYNDMIGKMKGFGMGTGTTSMEGRGHKRGMWR